MTVKVLMVAEKPSICTAVASALSKGNMTTRGKTPPVHEFQGNFLGKPAEFRVTSVVGHVFSMDFPPQYQNWNTVSPDELFFASVVSIPEGKAGIVKHLEREARGIDYLVLWLDCDREGENICFEVIRCVDKSMNKDVSGQKIYRAKFSAVTPKDIEKAMKTLGSPNENESKAVEARQELDLKVGVAFSRFQTKYFQGKYGDLDSSVISYGPCQSPTLGFCVDRHDEIHSFSPEKFWYLDVSLELERNQKIPLLWNRGRLFDQSAVEMFSMIVSGKNSSSKLTCIDVKEKETRRMRPSPLNTVEMLKLASRVLGMGPQAAMKAAEHLYLSGFISYPRTESTAYPSSFDFRDALSTLLQGPTTSSQREHIQRLLHGSMVHARAGHDAGDHPPITPVGVPSYSLSGDESRLYDLIYTHFLATVSPDAKFLLTKAVFRSVGGAETFSLSGKKEIDPGFLVLYSNYGNRNDDHDSDDVNEDDEEDYDNEVEIRDIPKFYVGQQYNIASINVSSGQTRPPGYLTEAELIGLMEKHGIGTDASIATHIQNIIQRNYVTLSTGRTLVPTTLGTVLVHGYQRIDPALVLPEVRAAIEKFCDMIAKGSAKKEQVVSHSLSNFQAKFRYFCQHISSMDSLFEASFTTLAQSGKPLSRCGKCNRYMKHLSTTPQRLYCAYCEATYNLPQNGTIKLYMESKCPLDNFELVLFSLGNSANAMGKSYPLCPYCYNHPPEFGPQEDSDEDCDDDNDDNDDNDDGAKGGGKDDNKKKMITKNESQNTSSNMWKGMGCNSCLHPTCIHSSVKHLIGDCPNESSPDAKSGAISSCSGKLILDMNSKPNWKIACNECNTILRFKADIHQITILHQMNACEDCGCKKVDIEFSKLRNPLKNGELHYSGCLFCDEFLSGLIETMTGRSINLQILKQKRSRQAARGRQGKKGGGKGRGKGKHMKKGFDIRLTAEGF